MITSPSSEKQIVKRTIPTGPLAGRVTSFDKSKLNDYEEVLVLYPHRAKPKDEQTARRVLPGEKYKVKGLDKAIVILEGWATLDLDAELPKINKRTIEQVMKKKPVKNQYELMVEQNEAIVSALDKLGKSMEAIVEKISKK